MRSDRHGSAVIRNRPCKNQVLTEPAAYHLRGNKFCGIVTKLANGCWCSSKQPMTWLLLCHIPVGMAIMPHKQSVTLQRSNRGVVAKILIHPQAMYFQIRIVVMSGPPARQCTLASIDNLPLVTSIKSSKLMNWRREALTRFDARWCLWTNVMSAS